MVHPVLRLAVVLAVASLLLWVNRFRLFPDLSSPSNENQPSAEKSEFLAIAERLERGDNQYLGRHQIQTIRSQLATADLSTEMTINLRLQLWSHLLRLGDMGAATEEIESAFSLAETVANATADQLAILHWYRTLNYLRLAEVTNCIGLNNRDCCIIPFQGGGIHSQPEPARKARESLLVLLKDNPEDLSLGWLLNIVSMAIGDHPEGVPARFRIPDTAFRSEYDVGRFVDVARDLGVNTFNQCGGAIVEDFDGDGFLDIVTSTFDPRGPLSFYRNLGNGRFEDVSESSGLEDQLGGLNCIGVDYDSDGDTDILVLRGAWLLDDGRIRNSLLRNNGDATFTDVTRQLGLAEPAFPTQSAVWGDFDNDGDLDLYVVNESRISSPEHDGDYPSQLFLQAADGTFRDVAERAGVTNDRYAKAVSAGDYDNDGDLDLYVSNLGPNRLYRNEGNGTFIDVAAQLGLTGPVASFATWFFDYDNDGRLDLFVAGYDTSIADILADYLGLQDNGVAPRLYRNLGNGRFRDVAAELGLDHPYLPMGANFGDLDGDGYLDIYLATGEPNYESLMPNVMLRNDRGKRFQDVTTSGGFGHLQKGHGVAFADIDNDGDQDIYNQLGGFYPGDAFHNALFRNPGHGNRHLIVKLVGSMSNRSAVGARIEVVIEAPGGRRSIHRAVGCVSSFGGSPLRQEIGLGDATRIERVEIRWPTSATTQVISGMALDTMIEIEEGKDTFRRIPLEAFVFDAP